MLKRFLLAAPLLFVVFLGQAQQGEIMLQGAAPKAWIAHSVQPKENWYSVGRIYNISPKEIAPFNGLSMDKGLTPGQALKIPLTAANFTSDKKAATGEVLVPVYYVVKEKEGLFRVAANAGTKMDQVKALNNLQSDALPNNARLIVGHLRVKQAESALANAAPVEVKEVVKINPPVVKKADPEKVVRPVERDYAKMPTEAEIKRDRQEMQQPKAPVKEAKETTPAEGEGYFKADFQRMASYGKEMKTASGQSGVFKTMSGWQDGKYYVLIDGVNPGSIVQVTHTGSGRSIYAKVLGEMQELRQNSGLIIRVSNAAASALQADGEIFAVTVKY